jgi:hypothetical protein
MAYLSSPASTSSYGVVTIGSNISVDINGVLSLPQSVATTSSISFNTVTVTNTTASSSTSTGALTVAGGAGFGGNIYAANIYDNGNRVITSVTANAGSGLSGGGTITGSSGTVTFTNTGVLSVTAGTGITVSTSTGAVTISANGSSIVNTAYVTSSSYTTLVSDEYIGVNYPGNCTITLTTGTNGIYYQIKKERSDNGNKITIQGSGGQQIDGSSSYILLLGYSSVSLVFRGGNWYIV